ncbi:putative MFS family arabinose efflux permease [Amycolatopsis lexingtonensis]|uniref:MFS family arabinose efflux permease n=1 Tax=Amycolatopsis lexingtonensis TaxID=218822 RepID=A0ABR9HRY5_9PSEU|nr:MFS transporter [Amycolatopsis lexingtonensis]MBE1493681.1 putative MFS family arabinose efflux permease [Amycolatopsis lexingtonensis]
MTPSYREPAGLRGPPSIHWAHERDPPARRGVRSGLIVTFLVVLAHFGTCTYLTPLLRDVVRP